MPQQIFEATGPGPWDVAISEAASARPEAGNGPLIALLHGAKVTTLDQSRLLIGVAEQDGATDEDHHVAHRAMLHLELPTAPMFQLDRINVTGLLRSARFRPDGQSSPGYACELDACADSPHRIIDEMPPLVHALDGRMARVQILPAGRLEHYRRGAAS